MLLCAFGEKEYKINPDVQTLESIETLQEIYTNQYVCHGNTLADAWRYLYVFGIPTKRCFPDTLESQFGSPTVQELSTSTNTPLCASYAGQYGGDKCLDGTPAKLYRSRIYYQVDPSLLELELTTRGPITTSFRVYKDFYTFSPRSQIYKSLEQGDVLGGHAVVIVGYGHSLDEGKYWVIANSFGPNWGRDGYFKMIRGEDNCGIESNAVVGIPDFFQGGGGGEGGVKEYYENPESPGGGLDPRTGFYRWIYEIRPDLANPEPLIRYHSAKDISWDIVNSERKIMAKTTTTTTTTAKSTTECKRLAIYRGVIISISIILLVILCVLITLV
jgi:hypothetical protein